MNIEQAKAIPIAEILDKLNVKPERVSGYDLYYKAPWRNERTASLHVNTQKNVWYDHGEGVGGDGLNLVCKHLESTNADHNVPDGLRWMNSMCGDKRSIQPIKDAETTPKTPKLNVTNVQEIKHPALIRYLESRGIVLSVAQRYLAQIDVYNKENHKSIFALGFRNEKGGYEVRNEFYQGTAGPKDVSIIRGSVIDAPGIHLFEGWPDFVTAIVRRNGKPFKNDTLVLNSLSNLEKATPFLKAPQYRFAYTWMDNDQPGKGATKSLDDFFKSEENFTHKPKNGIYAPYKDVNAWHMVKCGLTG